MRRVIAIIVLAVPAAVAVAIGSGVWPGVSALDVDNLTPVDRSPGVRPDVFGTVIPPNIAPLGFVVQEAGQGYHVRLSGPRGKAIDVSSDLPSIRFPSAAWLALLEANRGQTIHCDICVRDDRGQWTRYSRQTITIASEPIDRYLVYRRIRPLYNMWSSFGIYQRDLASFEETQLVDNTSFGTGCVNCHTFRDNRAEDMVVHTRGGTGGSSTILATGGKTRKVDTRTPFGSTGYGSWHPSGEMIVFAVVKVRQFFHSERREVRDVIDMDSTLVVYDVAGGRVRVPVNLSRKDRLETFPCWAPDGRTLYFSSARKPWPDDGPFPPKNYRDAKYDLMRVSYDPETGRWGTPETVLASATVGKSITQPRVSPDGRRLLCTMAEYGCFAVFQEDADLAMVDLATGRYERLAINSDQCDSWHTWSSNSRWIVFSSKRGNGLLARPYISYIDDAGTAHKPFVLPQENAEFYDSFIMTYNVPELVRDPVPVEPDAFGKVARQRLFGRRADATTGASRAVGAAPQPTR
jgi:WD40 repeat protein